MRLGLHQDGTLVCSQDPRRGPFGDPHRWMRSWTAKVINCQIRTVLSVPRLVRSIVPEQSLPGPLICGKGPLKPCH